MARNRNFARDRRDHFPHGLSERKRQIRDQPGPEIVSRCNGETNMRRLEIVKGPSRTRILMMTSAFTLIPASPAVTAPARAAEPAAKKLIDTQFLHATHHTSQHIKA